MDFSVEDLMKPAELPDQVVGSPDAKVTVVEYASMTCGHCAAFHKTVFPALKTKYVDTGKVRFIMREFPLDDLAAAGSMLSRCAGNGDTTKSLDMMSILFDKQEDWAFTRTNPVPKLFEIAKQAGFTQESFDKCLTDQKLLENITAIRGRRLREVRRELDADVLHQRQEADRRPVAGVLRQGARAAAEGILR